MMRNGGASSSSGTKFGVRNSSGKKMMNEAFVVWTFFVFRAMAMAMPAYATPHSADSRISRMTPTTPDLTRAPKANPTARTRIETAIPRVRSAASRPHTIAVRRIGAVNSLSR